jgi:hypothetical protein
VGGAGGVIAEIIAHSSKLIVKKGSYHLDYQLSSVGYQLKNQRRGTGKLIA